MNVPITMAAALTYVRTGRSAMSVNAPRDTSYWTKRLAEVKCPSDVVGLLVQKTWLLVMRVGFKAAFMLMYKKLSTAKWIVSSLHLSQSNCPFQNQITQQRKIAC